MEAWSGDKLRRTPMSGGWGEASFGVTGDIVCDNPKHPFHYEMKCREGWELTDLIVGVRKNHSLSIIQWWQQCTSQAPERKIPLLIFSKNRHPDLVMLLRNHFFDLIGTDFADEWIPHYTFEMTNPGRGHGNVVIMALDDFIARIQPPKGCNALDCGIRDERSLGPAP